MTVAVLPCPAMPSTAKGHVVEVLGRHAWEELADELGQMVVSGELRPGQRLVEAELADRFGISRGPVRTALQQLERTGLIEVRHRRGMVVAEITSDDISELYAVRIALEKTAVDVICDGVAGRDLSTIWQHVDAMETAAARSDWAAAAQADLAFHRALCELSGNSRLLRAWEPLSTQIRVIIGTLMKSEEAPVVAPLYGDHRSLLETMTSGDPQPAAGILVRHLEQSRDVMLARIARADDRPSAAS